MSAIDANIVVVGAGQAGAALVAKLRALGHSGPLTLIGDEPDLPYQRPPLSKAYLKGEMDRERLYLRPASFYEAEGIEVLRNHRVERILPATRRIVLGNGEERSYDRLALTLGATPRRLPAETGGALDGVHVMRMLADADGLSAHLGRGAQAAVIIGGGYIGLEAAAVLRHKGLQVTLLEAAPRILSRVASPETADYFRDLHQSNGVEILENTALSRLEGDDAGHVSAAILADGRRIPADLALVGIGVTPDIHIAQQAGLAIENGIRVDAQGRSSDEHIFAAGDCASFPYQGQTIRLESVPNAIDQAESMAASMLEMTSDYLAKPWFWSDQYDVKLQIAGLNTGYDRVILRPDAKPGSQSVWYYSGARLLAVDAMNDPRAYMIGKRLIEAGKSPEASLIADPETNLKALL